MLRLMRDHAASWVIKIVLGAIVVVFMFWGIGGDIRQPKERILATVNEEIISSEQYRDEYNKLVQRYRQFGSKLNESMVKMLEKQALDNLIDQTLLRQEAKKLGIRISDTELADAIGKIDAFRTAGIFNDSLYRRVLNANRLTPEMFETLQKKSMMTGKVRSLVLSSIKVSDDEAMEWYQWNDASVSIDYVFFSTKEYKDIKPSEEEVKAFYEERGESYKSDPQVKVQYIRFDVKDYVSKVELADEEIQDYHNENQGEFKTEKTVQARHILLKLEEKASEELGEEKRRKAAEIMEKAKAGEDFAELAKTYSEGPTKSRGGDLGAFKREAMVKPFSDKAFSMKPGEISEPVRTKFGWHVIKVEKVNEAGSKSLEDAKPDITKKLRDQKAKDMAYDEAEALYDSVFEGDNLTDIAKTKGLEIKTTELFTKKKGPEEGVKNRFKFSSEAFKLAPLEISEIQDLGNEYYIIQSLEKVPEKPAEFEEAKTKVRRDLIKEKQGDAAKTDAEAFLTTLKNGGSMSEVCEEQELSLKTTDFFKRSDSIPDIGYEKELSKVAFSLSAEKKLSQELVKGQKGYYVVAYREKKIPDAESFGKEKKDVKDKLLQQKQFKAFDAWMSDLKEKNQISIDADFLN